MQTLENLECKEDVAACLKKIEAATLQLYKTLRMYTERELEVRRILDEHLIRISEFYEALCKAELGTRKNMTLTAAA